MSSLQTLPAEFRWVSFITWVQVHAEASQFPPVATDEYIFILLTSSSSMKEFSSCYRAHTGAALFVYDAYETLHSKDLGVLHSSWKSPRHLVGFTNLSCHRAGRVDQKHHTLHDITFPLVHSRGQSALRCELGLCKLDALKAIAGNFKSITVAFFVVC